VKAQTDKLISEAQAALMRGDAPTALGLLAQADAGDAGNAAVKMQTALAHRMAGDLPAAVRALDAAIAIDPYDLLATLSKGAILERLSGERAAATVYKYAINMAPPADRLAPHLQAPMARAREVVARIAEALEAHLQDSVREVAADCGPMARSRFDEALRIYAGTAKVYRQEPLLMHYPGLPAIPFLDREAFPWLAELERATDVIRGELEAVLADPGPDMVPYIAYPPGAPVNQWAELNHSPRWSSYFLWKDGVRQVGACARCPGTAALLDTLPMADQPGFAPTAMFSALAANTHIPPHTGSTNTRLLTHLPLILPGPARFRVGNQVREWRMGEAWVFDDTIEHEAWNDADELRVILIFDIWNPLLDAGERALISAIMTARNAFFDPG
jgi:hypothetical protein